METKKINLDDNDFKADIDFLKSREARKELNGHYKKFKELVSSGGIDLKTAQEPSWYISGMDFAKTEDSQCVYMSTYGVGDWGNCDG